MKIIQRPASAVVAIMLGVVVLFVGAPLAMLSDGNWPWHTSIIGPAADGGSTTVEIIDEDGTQYRLTASPTDAHSWLERKEDELRNAHGIPMKIAIGNVLVPVGLALLLLGLALLLWWLVTVCRARSTRLPTELPNN